MSDQPRFLPTGHSASVSDRHEAEPVMCPKCSTTTWTRNRYVVRCRYCDHVWSLRQ